jgi:hypothetical protein
MRSMLFRDDLSIVATSREKFPPYYDVIRLGPSQQRQPRAERLRTEGENEKTSVHCTSWAISIVALWPVSAHAAGNCSADQMSALKVPHLTIESAKEVAAKDPSRLVATYAVRSRPTATARVRTRQVWKSSCRRNGTINWSSSALAVLPALSCRRPSERIKNVSQMRIWLLDRGATMVAPTPHSLSARAFASLRNAITSWKNCIRFFSMMIVWVPSPSSTYRL